MRPTALHRWIQRPSRGSQHLQTDTALRIQIFHHNKQLPIPRQADTPPGCGIHKRVLPGCSSCLRRLVADTPDWASESVQNSRTVCHRCLPFPRPHSLLRPRPRRPPFQQRPVLRHQLGLSIRQLRTAVHCPPRPRSYSLRVSLRPRSTMEMLQWLSSPLLVQFYPFWECQLGLNPDFLATLCTRECRSLICLRQPTMICGVFANALSCCHGAVGTQPSSGF
jgi:hypothetical protein